MKKVFILTACFILIFSLSACKKKEQQPVQQMPAPMGTGPIPSEPIPPGQMMPGQMPPAMAQQGQQQPAGPGMMMQRGKSQIIVPESVKGKWSGARIIFEDKSGKTKQEYTVRLNSEFKIPNTNLNLHIGDFLPDFRMDGMNLTSSTNQPNNPALGVQVFESDKKIFPASGKQWGWLFAKVPAIHPFEHPKYSIILKEGIKK
jgi:hypothetical protein